MPGWRVGYCVFPVALLDDMRKVQDTVPTHTAILSQKLACHALDADNEEAVATGSSWVTKKVQFLQTHRDKFHAVLARFGCKKPTGAFYFLLKLPSQLAEDRAVDVLAREHKVLVMPGTVFGAHGWIRISYGSLPDEATLERIGVGLASLWACVGEHC